MFMGVVSRPRWDENGNNIHSGLLGIFPFTQQVRAKKSSINRPRGTMETKPIDVVNRDVFMDMITTKVIPSIMEHWPMDSDKTIFIQADNAKPHCGSDIAQFISSYNQNGFNFIWAPQPPNSPDLNILDLGLFHSIQAKYEKSMPSDIDVLIEEVEKAFYDTHPKTLSNVWYSLQYCMCEIMKAKGNCNYMLPHKKKKQLEDAGNLPLQVSPELHDVRAVMQLLFQATEM
ncbi:Cordon-bleu protein-like 1 [Bienertia sinuspersici]